MSLEERKKKCPRCGAVITFYPAISRKDNKTEICSDCGAIEAIEEYINHKNKLEEGMYVRTKWGIAKIIGFEARNIFIKLDKKIMFENLPEYYDYITIADILKASHNIIDLIEVGDVITTNNLCGEVTHLEEDKIYTTCYDGEYCYDYQIQSILTKEAFERMSYEVK